MKKYLSFFICLTVGALVFVGTVFASAPDTAWTRLDEGVQEATFVQQTHDGGYIITGDGYGITLLKIDSLGNKEWDDSLCSEGGGDCVRQTADNGYILTGSKQMSTGSVSNLDVVLCKVNSVGNEEWFKTFGGAANDWGNSVQQTQDGGYICVGWTRSYGAGGADVWLIKTDSLGNKEWDKTFGGSNDDWGNSVQQTQDGGYICVGWTRSYGAGGADAWLIKTDSLGNKRWDKTFGGASDDYGYSVQQTPDGGYIIGGTTNSYDTTGKGWLIKTDSLGNKEWDKLYGNWGFFYCVQQTSDKGYIINGKILDTVWGTCLWIMKTDSSGDSLWTIEMRDSLGATFGCSIQQTQDGGYIVGGTKAINPNPYYVGWIIKLKSDAGIEEGYKMQDTEHRLVIAPNPNGKKTSIQYTVGSSIISGSCKCGDKQEVKLKVYDIDGRAIETLVQGEKEPGNYSVNFMGKSGVYFVELTTDNYKTTKKLILL